LSATVAYLVADHESGILLVSRQTRMAVHTSVLMNQGKGAFAPAVDYAVGAGLTAVVAADLNGDGSPDLAVTDTTRGTVNVMLTTCFP
jgi:hypothetical protein